MAGTKHTAGPWDYFVGNANGRGLVRVETSHLSSVAGLFIASMPRGAESEANAHLIAAAPDLLAALKEAEADLSLAAGIAIGYDLAPVLATIRAAIAKAEGFSHD